MKVKLKPMSEAPAKKKIIVKGKDGEQYIATVTGDCHIGLGRDVRTALYCDSIRIDEFIGWTELPEVEE